MSHQEFGTMKRPDMPEGEKDPKKVLQRQIDTLKEEIQGLIDSGESDASEIDRKLFQLAVLIEKKFNTFGDIDKEDALLILNIFKKISRNKPERAEDAQRMIARYEGLLKRFDNTSEDDSSETLKKYGLVA